MISKKIEVYGRVQSVGFRPFVYNLAKKFNVKGYVKNKTSYVEIVVNGELVNIENFLDKLKNPPYPVKIDKIVIENFDTKFDDFYILESEDSQPQFLYIPAEIKTCQECLKELFNPQDRRFLYPFINCTHCGPRFTIIKNLPYDRINTTMNVFTMCDECQTEYEDPTNRRFHAQPNSCYKCGPNIELRNNKLEILFPKAKCYSDVEKILEFVVKEILLGKIFAIKSYGGYHLVCDATNDEIVLRLRKNKYREYKPFAMMANDIENIKKYCYVSADEEKILSSSQAPIVLLVKKEDNKISKYVAPNSIYYGFMLPYTPLQFLIFYFLKKYNNVPLIMTSGNLSDEPQVYTEEEAYKKLSNIADYFLIYDREINIRCDDSVVRVYNGDTYFIRRSRGYAPEPIFISFEYKNPELCFGADLKNTFCLAKNNYIILSHHIGDLDNLEAVDSYKKSVEYYLKTFKFEPEIVVCDLHPRYFSSKTAEEYAYKNKLKLVKIQHHYAHMLSCMLDNEMFDESIGVIFDGTGYGLDGKIWGSEFLVGDTKSFIRKGHFEYITLVSGDIGIQQPFRPAFGFIYEEYKDKNLIKKFYEKVCGIDNIPDFEELYEMVRFLIEEKINVYDVCGIGRIFDIVGVFCDLGFYNYHEGYLPALCEFYATKKFNEIKNKNLKYNYEIKNENGVYIVSTRKILKEVFEDVMFNCLPKDEVSAKFHYTLISATVDVVLKIRDELNINKIVLSGGVFQNKILFETLVELLKKENFEVYNHKRFPTNDAGISAGQSLAASVDE
jgi:hydrogenase maturation protein HypF